MPTTPPNTREWIAAHLAPMLWTAGFSRADLKLRRARVRGFRCSIRGWTERGRCVEVSATAQTRAGALVAATRRFSRVQAPESS